ADKTTYLWTLRDDVKFSDGQILDADDVIFSYYVYADPTYTGSTSLYSVPIVGMQNYRTQTSDEVYAKFDKMFDEIYKAGESHTWSASDGWSQDQQTSFWAIMKQEWVKDVQAIVDYCVANYSADAETAIGIKAEDLDTDGEKVALGMAMWGYGKYADGVLTAPSGKTFDLKGGTFPTIEDYYAETYAAYNGDPIAYFDTEAADDTSVVDEARGTFISTEGPKDPSLGGAGIPNIAGIKKISQTQVEVTVKGFDATAIYSLGITVAPLHYYGEESKYDYANNKFGFDFKDLKHVSSLTTQPLGAGPYKFVKYENKIVYFEANEFYYRGVPKTRLLQFKETLDPDKISGVKTGTIDITDPSFSTAAIDQVKSYNSNGELSGNVIETNTVDNRGYGYVGMNAAKIKVGEDPTSDASRALRTGMATLIAAYRDLTVDSYYGDRATVINYPISNTSWAAPQKSDSDYKVAFSTKLDGTPIYTSDMTPEQKYDAALKAAIEYFKAAGYTFDEASGKFTAAPAGAKLQYELIVPGDGQGDHPSFMLATKVKESLQKIGMDLIINDPTASTVLWDKIDAAEQEMWCAAWQATIDPDMYQTYYSTNIVGLPGSTESNHYHIQDKQLDELIMAARKSDDQAYRKATYKACLDIIIDWAVEIPIYQRQNCVIFSAERIKLDTITPDITTFWGWMNDVELIEMQ
ncbi:MAG: ABC transporter substrate-binding protein, partial [Clostridium sp. SCN 57-10]